MPLLYLIIAFVTGIGELFTGTFYLAAVSSAALLTLATSWWLPHSVLHWVFLAFSVSLIGLAGLLRHRLARRATGIDDLDLGQQVELRRGPDAQGQYRVRYRGSDWSARPEGSAPLPVGSIAVIVGREGNLLLIAPLPPSTIPPLPAPEAAPCPPSSSSSSS